MVDYREILRQASQQNSQRSIAVGVHCSRHTVSDVLSAAAERDMSHTVLRYQRRRLPASGSKMESHKIEASRCLKQTVPQGEKKRTLCLHEVITLKVRRKSLCTGIAKTTDQITS